MLASPYLLLDTPTARSVADDVLFGLLVAGKRHGTFALYQAHSKTRLNVLVPCAFDETQARAALMLLQTAKDWGLSDVAFWQWLGFALDNHLIQTQDPARLIERLLAVNALPKPAYTRYITTAHGTHLPDLPWVRAHLAPKLTKNPMPMQAQITIIALCVSSIVLIGGLFWYVRADNASSASVTDMPDVMVVKTH